MCLLEQTFSLPYDIYQISSRCYTPRESELHLEYTFLKLCALSSIPCLVRVAQKLSIFHCQTAYKTGNGLLTEL